MMFDTAPEQTVVRSHLSTNDQFRLIDTQKALAEQRGLVKRWQNSRLIHELLLEARAIRLHWRGKGVRL